MVKKIETREMSTANITKLCVNIMVPHLFKCCFSFVVVVSGGGDDMHGLIISKKCK